MKGIKALPKIQQLILKRLILNSPHRPVWYSFDDIYKKLDFEKYTDNDAFEAISGLLAEGYLIQNNEAYSLCRDGFMLVKKHFWLLILISQNPQILLTIPFVAFMLFIYIFNAHNNNSAQKRIINIGTDINKLHHTNNNKIVNVTPSMSNDVKANMNYNSAYIRDSDNRLRDIEKSLAEINIALGNNPTKAIQISTMRAEIDNLKNENKLVQQSMSKEIDRISSYNNSIIALMITFMLGLIGLSVFNGRKRNDG